MSLDPQIAELLQQREDPLPPLDGDSLAAMRQGFRSAKIAETIPSHLASIKTTELALDGEGGELRARWYEAEAATSAATLFFHGGGWVLGDLDTHDLVCRRIAKNMNVLSVDYRRAPESPFPAAVQDGLVALRWLGRNHPESATGPEGRLAVAGTSAGANIAAGVARRWNASHPRSGARVCVQLLAYPVLDTRFDQPSAQEYGDGYYLRTADMERFVEAYVPSASDRDDAEVAPLRAPVLKWTPATVLVSAEFDPLRDQSLAYLEKLRRTGVPVVHVPGQGLIHGFFGMVDRSRRASEACQDSIQAFSEMVLDDGRDVTRPAGP